MSALIAESLHALSDTDLRLIGSDDDIRHRPVLDCDGKEIGVVEDLVLDDKEHKVWFIRVSSHGFLGIGGTKFLIPVTAIDCIDERHVHLGTSRDHLTLQPTYDPQFESRSYLEREYEYTGHAPPPWSPGSYYPYPF